MRKLIILLVAFTISGCTTTSDGITNNAFPEAEYRNIEKYLEPGRQSKISENHMSFINEIQTNRVAYFAESRPFSWPVKQIFGLSILTLRVLSL